QVLRFQLTVNDGNSSNITTVDVTVLAPSLVQSSQQSTGVGPSSEQSQPENNGNTQNNDINWESLCNSYGSLVGLKQPCSYYAHGTQLTPAGGQALICLLGGGLLAVI